MGPLSLSSFNLFYKTFSKLHRVLPKDERMKEPSLCEMLNTIMFKDSSLSSLYEMKLTVTPHHGNLKVALDTIRTMLRSREVRRVLCEPSSESLSNADVSALVAKAAGGDKGALKALSALVAAVDPTKNRNGGGANGGGGAGRGAGKPAAGKVKVPRDKTGRIIKWLYQVDNQVITWL